MLDLTSRFRFGVNLDDAWRYAGFEEPKSIIFPHLLSVGLPESRVLDKIDELIIREHHDLEPKAEAARASLSLAENLSDARVDFVRCWFSWRFFEPRLVPAQSLDTLLEESYQEWPMDNLVDTLTARGIGIVPVLACGYQRMLPGDLRVDSDRELYLKRASIHARLLVRRYRDRIRFWQIENEPNWWEMHVAGGWRSGLSWVEGGDFKFKLLKTLNDSVHEEDHNVMTIINVEGDAKTLDPSPYAAFCDILGFDFYPNYKAPAPLNVSVFERVDEFSRLIKKPILISETGYPSGPLFLGYTPGKQTEYVGLACKEAFHRDSLTALGIWRYIDTSWRSFPEQENHFGLFDSHGRAKPAWQGFAAVMREIRGR